MYDRERGAFRKSTEAETWHNDYFEIKRLKEFCVSLHGCLEAVKDGKTSFLCGARNTQSLVQQMERFIKLSYERKRQMVQALHDFVAERFDKKKGVQETVEILYGREA